MLAPKAGSRHSLVRRDLPRLAAPAEPDGGDGVAREAVQAPFLVEDRRARDRRVERLDGGGRAVHERRARVDDRVEVADGRLGADGRGRARRLPEPGRRVDLVVLDRPGVEAGVRAAEEELGAVGRELEAEHPGVGGPAGGDRVEERVLGGRRVIRWCNL